MKQDEELSRLSFRIFWEICRDRCRKGLYYNRLNKQILILDIDHPHDLTEIGVFTPKDTPKSIYTSLERNIRTMIDGARIPVSMSKYASFIQANYGH